MAGFFDTPIEFLKGVGPQKAALLNKELEIHTFADLIQHYPFRYEDRTRFYSVKDIESRLFSGEEMPSVQLKGRIKRFALSGPPRKKRLSAIFEDQTGEIELIWFQGVQWMASKLRPGATYVAYGKPVRYGMKINIAHPEMEVLTPGNSSSLYLQPVYHSTETLKKKFLDSKAISKLQWNLLELASGKIKETLSEDIIRSYTLLPKAQAINQIHFPQNEDMLAKARFRLKFEELFFIQLRLLKMKQARTDKYRGEIYSSSRLLTEFYEQHLPFPLTGAQKRVIKEIYRDLRSGNQMNRLLQGDVGSGKTIVAFICMLIVIEGAGQAALMAPTEILAVQHYNGLKAFAQKVGLRIALLTGSSKQSERKPLLQALHYGEIHILVGTHALIEEKVKFNRLGLAIVDEQHRFGVAQRSKLWQKNKDIYPHVLVMTATPIPRTLAMTLYGDLDVSVIDEMPKGRKPIQTIHRYDSNRLKVFQFMKDQIATGRQVYVVYPLIEESEKLDLKHLEDGYESICRAFPNVPVSIVHGRMKPENKDFEMQRFVKGETKIMVATTVIEVGVNVPNASVMVIENAERFGLAQLHQLRGRVGRGAEQSFCILMTSLKLSKEARVRVDTMVKTNNGFDISDVDLKLRGPGDLMGTQQSGVLDLLIADLGSDGKILKIARDAAGRLLKEDPKLERKENTNISLQVSSQKKDVLNWSRIS